MMKHFKSKGAITLSEMVQSHCHTYLKFSNGNKQVCKVLKNSDLKWWTMMAEWTGLKQYVSPRSLLARPRKKIDVFPLTCSKILGSAGRKKILFKKIFLASFYGGHILTLIVLVQKWPKKLYGRHKKLGSVGLAETHVILFLAWPRDPYYSS